VFRPSIATVLTAMLTAILNKLKWNIDIYFCLVMWSPWADIIPSHHRKLSEENKINCMGHILFSIHGISCALDIHFATKIKWKHMHLGNVF
jgi:hypothetical protein